MENPTSYFELLTLQRLAYAAQRADIEATPQRPIADVPSAKCLTEKLIYALGFRAITFIVLCCKRFFAATTYYFKEQCKYSTIFNTNNKQAYIHYPKGIAVLRLDI